MAQTAVTVAGWEPGRRETVVFIAPHQCSRPQSPEHPTAAQPPERHFGDCHLWIPILPSSHVSGQCQLFREAREPVLSPGGRQLSQLSPRSWGCYTPSPPSRLGNRITLHLLGQIETTHPAQKTNPKPTHRTPHLAHCPPAPQNPAGTVPAGPTPPERPRQRGV